MAAYRKPDPPSYWLPMLPFDDFTILAFCRPEETALHG
jgi:hypothetical protein